VGDEHPVSGRFRYNLYSGVRCHPLDPSQSPEYSPTIPGDGISCKTIYDCTVPFALKEKFKRAEFKEVNPQKWLQKE
jgi:4-hydroxy-3-polyprenylbenzoate decarboxylase